MVGFDYSMTLTAKGARFFVIHETKANHGVLETEGIVASLVLGQGFLGPGHGAWREDRRGRRPREVLARVCPTPTPEIQRDQTVCGEGRRGDRAWSIAQTALPSAS